MSMRLHCCFFFLEEGIRLGVFSLEIESFYCVDTRFGMRGGRYRFI